MTKRMNRAEHKLLREAAFKIYLEMLADPELRARTDVNFRNVALESFRVAHERMKAAAGAQPKPDVDTGAADECSGPALPAVSRPVNAA